MIYLLDTNICVMFLRNRSARVRRAIQQTQATHIALCAVVVAELYEGAYRSAQQVRNLAQVAAFIEPFVVLPFDTAAAEIAGRQGAELAARGMLIGAHDLQIAAIALAHNLILVTQNTHEFSRVGGLRLEDWEQDDGTPNP